MNSIFLRIYGGMLGVLVLREIGVELELFQGDQAAQTAASARSRQPIWIWSAAAACMAASC